MAQLTIDITGARAYELYGNLLSNEAHELWEKIIQIQVDIAHWEDSYYMGLLS